MTDQVGTGVFSDTFDRADGAVGIEWTKDVGTRRVGPSRFDTSGSWAVDCGDTPATKHVDQSERQVVNQEISE